MRLPAWVLGCLLSLPALGLAQSNPWIDFRANGEARYGGELNEDLIKAFIAEASY